MKRQKTPDQLAKQQLNQMLDNLAMQRPQLTPLAKSIQQHNRQLIHQQRVKTAEQKAEAKRRSRAAFQIEV